MKKFSKKGVLLLAGAMAVCAFVTPSMASAASWGVIGTEHTLHSSNIAFTADITPVGAFASSCGESTFTVDVRNAATLTVTSASFRNCTALGTGIGDCTVTPVATNLPWAATGVTTSNIQIHDVRIDVRFETRPGGGAGSCTNVHNVDLPLTGTLSSGVWSSTGHEISYNQATGLVLHRLFHPNLGNATPVTVSGTMRDTQQSLALS
jgi:hypothetical protein